MRIISGKYRGIKFDGYDIDGTRPTMDRVKESLIGMIQSKIKGSVCLDLFTGSGSVGVELISNGASKCYFVDNNKIVINTLKRNLEKIRLEDGYEIIRDEFLAALKKMGDSKIKFDIIFLDPPYKETYITKSINAILENDLLNEDGIIVCEYETEKIDIKNLNIYKEREYGSKKIVVLKK